MTTNIIDKNFILALYSIDETTFNAWLRAGLPKEGRGKYDLLNCVRWVYEHQQKEIEEAKYLTRKGVAKLLNYKNEKYINELERDFGLPKINWNKYDIYQVIQWYINYIEGIHTKEIQKLKEEKPQDELARKSARLKELEIQEREGKLVDLDYVKWAWIEEYKLLDEILAGIGAKLAPKLLKKENATEIRFIIDEEIKKAKEKIAQLPIKEEE